ncbi:DUF3043 family protein [Rarobacter incanus]|uniref:DUF3043 family protein n=2 Tax=Rarobacter incanus TaxID=153494 RepID=A0A542SMI8_9MICO|nr:DUF3043 family protein [Rarobacter incanus]
MNPDNAAESTDPAERQGKGHATPSRKEAEAANRRPLVANDRKAAAKAARDKDRIERDREYHAMKVGDVAHYPVRERGPVKAYIRDFVDARWNLGEFFLVSAIVLLILSVVTNKWPVISLASMGIVYVYGILAIGDTFVMWFQLKKRLKAKFSEHTLSTERSLGIYAASRALQFRRWRMPRPRFDKHGNYPE